MLPPNTPTFKLSLFSGYDRMMVLSTHRWSCFKKLFHLISLTCQGLNWSQRRRAPLASNKHWCNQVIWCDIGVSASGCLLQPCVQKERKNARRGDCFHFSTACNYPCICLWCHGATLPTQACASDLVLGEEMKAWRDSLLWSSFKASATKKKSVDHPKGLILCSLSVGGMWESTGGPRNVAQTTCLFWVWMMWLRSQI